MERHVMPVTSLPGLGHDLDFEWTELQFRNVSSTPSVYCSSLPLFSMPSEGQCCFATLNLPADLKEPRPKAVPLSSQRSRCTSSCQPWIMHEGERDVNDLSLLTPCTLMVYSSLLWEEYQQVSLSTSPTLLWDIVTSTTMSFSQERVTTTIVSGLIMMAVFE